MHLEAVMEGVGRCTWSRYSNVFGDTLGGCDPQVNLEMHSEITIERVWRCAWRPRSCELEEHHGASFGIRLGGHDQARLDEYLEVVNRRCAGC